MKYLTSRAKCGEKEFAVRYEKQNCPHCHREFAKNDDIVVCPVCGTPHHRQCWHEGNGCENAFRHDEGYSYTAGRDAQPHACPRCGNENPSDALYCNKCGADLTMADGSSADEKNASDKQPFGSARTVFGFMGNNPYENSTEEIDGVSVSKLSKYVMLRTSYYIPNFLKLCKRKIKASWNWAAFIMPSCVWFYYRKCYLFGTLAALFNVFLEILFKGFLNEFVSVSDLYYSGNVGEFMTQFQNLVFSKQGIAFFSISIVFKFILGIFGNALYKSKAISDIKSGKEISGTNIIAPVFGYYAFTYLLPSLINLFI